MIILTQLLLIIIGALCIQTLCKTDTKLNVGLHIVIAYGVGAGVCSLLTFYSLIIFQQYNRGAVIILTLIVLGILLFINRNSLQKIQFKPVWKWSLAGKILLWIVGCVLLYIISRMHYWGEWDAWALYNMKLKFLLFAGKDWTSIFSQLHWSTQPDYPLLLPCLNAWHYSFFAGNISLISYATGLCFAFGCSILVYFGLRQFSSSILVFIASIYLLSSPFFSYWATSQYADILLAFYLLTAVILTLLYIKERASSTALLLGGIMGLMTFTKNEGIAISFILCVSLTLYFLTFERTHFQKTWKFMSKVLLGICILAAGTVILKLFFAPPNRDILTNLGNDLPYFNWKGLRAIGNGFIKEVTDKRWCGAWFFLGILYLIKSPKLIYKENKVISYFFVLYIFVLMFIYLTTSNFSLPWRIESTMFRILGYLLPTLVFFVFYLYLGTPQKQYE